MDVLKYPLAYPNFRKCTLRHLLECKKSSIVIHRFVTICVNDWKKVALV